MPPSIGSQLIKYEANQVPAIAGALDALSIWNDSSKAKRAGEWGKSAWDMVSSVVRNVQTGKSSWAKYMGEFVNKEWKTSFAKATAARAVKRFFDTAQSKEMNPNWDTNDEIVVLNAAAEHETGTVVKQISSTFFHQLRDFEDSRVVALASNGDPDMTPSNQDDGRSLLIKGGEVVLATMSGDALAARGVLIDLGKTELGPLLADAFKELPQVKWLEAIDKEWDVEDSNFQENERVVTRDGKLATVKGLNMFKKGITLVKLDDGQELEVESRFLNRVFKRNEFVWTARFEPLAQKVVKSIGLIVRVIKTNLFYQVRSLALGTQDLYLAKYMQPMEAKYQAVLNSTPMVQDFKSAAMMDRVVQSPCGIQRRMRNSLQMHEGRMRRDQQMTRELTMVADANAQTYTRVHEKREFASIQGEIPVDELPWNFEHRAPIQNFQNNTDHKSGGVIDWLWSHLWGPQPKQTTLSIENTKQTALSIQDPSRNEKRRRLVTVAGQQGAQPRVEASNQRAAPSEPTSSNLQATTQRLEGSTDATCIPAKQDVKDTTTGWSTTATIVVMMAVMLCALLYFNR